MESQIREKNKMKEKKVKFEKKGKIKGEKYVDRIYAPTCCGLLTGVMSGVLDPSGPGWIRNVDPA